MNCKRAKKDEYSKDTFSPVKSTWFIFIGCFRESYRLEAAKKGKQTEKTQEVHEARWRSIMQRFWNSIKII